MKKLLTNKPKAGGRLGFSPEISRLPAFFKPVKTVMKITAILEIPEDFRLHCEIYNCNAQDVLQEFVNQVSLPRHGTDEGNGYECATGFFMDYADQLLLKKGQPADIHDHYLDKLAETVVPIRDKQQREDACRKILRQWALAVSETNKS